MDFAFILDPLPELKAYKDSSVAMMRALAARGHRGVRARAGGPLLGRGGSVKARVVPLTLSADDHDWYRAGRAEERRAARASPRCCMRKDPPFDMEYVYATYLLELAEREGARVFNRPRAIRDHNEKLAIARFAEFIAPTLVTRDAGRINAFIDRARRHDPEAARRHGRRVGVPRARRRPQPQRDRRDRRPARARAR